MKEIWKMASLRIKISLTLFCVALIASIVGLFILKSEMRVISWVCIVVALAIDYWVVIEENFKLNEESFLKDYEIIELRYSYRQMGKYIDSLDIEELKDIELRIENELSDIKIRKDHKKSKKWQSK